MRTAIPTTLTAALFCLLAGAAHAQPAQCFGRFAVVGASIDLGAGADPLALVSVSQQISLGGDAGALIVGVGDGRVRGGCRADLVTQVPRDDAFVVRARFVGCGERPRFRLRLAFDADCQRATAKLRSGGQLVAQFTADFVPFNEPNTPTDPADPTDPSDEPAPVDPPDPSEETATPIGTTPSITAFSPFTARRGDSLSIFGHNLDRDQNGDRWVGVSTTPPFVVTFLSSDGSFGRLRATPTFVSAGEIKLTVPSLAISGTLILATGTRFGPLGGTLSETAERLVIVVGNAEEVPPVPTGGTPPATANTGTLTVQESLTSLFDAGAFPVTGPFQIGAFLDSNGNGIVDLIGGANDVPYPAFPVRTSEFDFTITAGRAYFPGANAMLWVFFEAGDPAVLTSDDRFFVVHLNVDLAARTARPVAMLAGVGGEPGIVLTADQFSTATINVAQPGGGIGALRGTIAAVPQFLELIFFPSQVAPCFDPSGFCPDFGPSFEQRLWANGVTIDFDVPLFSDN